MRNKWPDFLFTIAVRLACGAVLGAIAGLLIGAPISRYAAHRPSSLWVFGDKDHPRRPYYWFGAWSLGGAIIAMWTTPRWQTPWYRRNADDLNILEMPSQDHVSIRTVSEDGEEHEYSSMEEVPQEMRSEIEAFKKEMEQQKGNEFSVIESSPTGDVVSSKIIFRRKDRSEYKIVDESGVETIYHSLEEMPPEIRAAVAEAEEKSKK